MDASNTWVRNYAASAHDAPQRPALAEGIDCDVCVVGAGIAGCSTALHLALAGLRVVLLEEQRWAGAPRGAAARRLSTGSRPARPNLRGSSAPGPRARCGTSRSKPGADAGADRALLDRV